MNRNSSRPDRLASFWTLLVDASSAAVDIHYDAPWQRAAKAPVPALRHRRGAA
ncbi:MAG: hypothetical protein U0S50_09810 [Sphingopyxis sp.]|uniref:hypothetical protein n=1 Tax=Sphingopyxis sp. TaxID=1908224 RepID=UPI002AB80F54|nr:hypothetical protein [Sphingopyxis sp.]MDZ3832098.1 hypothetical protein [Sphingopyxis sp.]